jgi:hypothetical protein
MRVVRLGDDDVPVVVHIRRHNEVLVAIPARLPETDILSIASLLLSDDEFAELASELVHERGDQPAPPPP